MLMPPLPAMLMEMVNISERYIEVGSAISPNLNAVRGANRSDDAIDLFVCFHVVLSDKGTNLLSRVVVLFVYARRKQIAAQHDATTCSGPKPAEREASY